MILSWHLIIHLYFVRGHVHLCRLSLHWGMLARSCSETQWTNQGYAALLFTRMVSPAGAEVEGNTSYMGSLEKVALLCNVQAQIKYYLCLKFSLMISTDQHTVKWQISRILQELFWNQRVPIPMTVLWLLKISMYLEMSAKHDLGYLPS